MNWKAFADEIALAGMDRYMQNLSNFKIDPAKILSETRAIDHIQCDHLIAAFVTGDLSAKH